MHGPTDITIRKVFRCLGVVGLLYHQGNIANDVTQYQPLA